jgi:hypothetical protein
MRSRCGRSSSRPIPPRMARSSTRVAWVSRSERALRMVAASAAVRSASASRSARPSSSSRMSPGSRSHDSMSLQMTGSRSSALMPRPRQRPSILPRSCSCPPQRYQTPPRFIDPTYVRPHRAQRRTDLSKYVRSVFLGQMRWRARASCVACHSSSDTSGSSEARITSRSCFLLFRP